MMTRGRAAASFVFLFGVTLSCSVLRIATAADAVEGFIKKAAEKPQPNSNPEVLVAEARLAELNRRLTEQQRELSSLKSQAERTRATVNANKEQEPKVYRSVEELFAGLPKEAYPVAGPNGSIERAATRKWLTEKLGAHKTIIEWDATVKEVEDNGTSSYTVTIFTDVPAASRPIVLGELTCQLKMFGVNNRDGTNLNADSKLYFSDCTAEEVKLLRALKGKKVTFRGVLKKAEVISKTAAAKEADQPPQPQIEIYLPLSELSADGFRTEYSKKSAFHGQPPLTKEKLLVAEARLVDLDRLLAEKEQELAGLEREADVQRKLTDTAKKPEAKVFRKAEELLESIPKEVYPITGPNSSIERNATRLWLNEKIGNRLSGIEWEATVKKVEDQGDDPFTVLIVIESVPRKEPLTIGGLPCRVTVAEPSDEHRGSFKPTIAYSNCTADEVRMLRALQGKKVALRGLIKYCYVGFNKTTNEIVFTLHLDETSINGFLPAANAEKQSGRFRN